MKHMVVRQHNSYTSHDLRFLSELHLYHPMPDRDIILNVCQEETEILLYLNFKTYNFFLTPFFPPLERPLFFPTAIV